MGRAATAIAAAIAAFLVEVGRIIGVRQATEQIASDAARDSEAARVAVSKAQAEAKGDVVAALRRHEL